MLFMKFAHTKMGLMKLKNLFLTPTTDIQILRVIVIKIAIILEIIFFFKERNRKIEFFSR